MARRTSDQIPMDFDARAAAAARDKAVEDARIGAYDWIDFAMAAIRSVAARGKPFTTDDVWELLGEHPAEPRAMGAAMTRARHEKLCKASQEWRLSSRVACHRRPLRVWIPLG